VIGPEIRRAVLANFPAGTMFADAAAGIGAIDAAAPHVLLEGLDAVDDPVGFLSALRVHVPRARLFALVANAAHLPALGAFFAGQAQSAGHPLVRAEIEPLFLAAGWQPTEITPIADGSLPPAQAVPVEINTGAIIFQIVDPAVLERARSAAFFIVADAR
jgi:hypothetical protein